QANDDDGLTGSFVVSEPMQRFTAKPASSTSDVLQAVLDTSGGLANKSAYLGGACVSMVLCPLDSFTGWPERGETVTIDGTYSFVLREYNPNRGALFVEEWLTPPTSHTGLDGKPVAGASGFTATALTASTSSIGNYAPNVAWLRQGPSNRYVLG